MTEMQRNVSAVRFVSRRKDRNMKRMFVRTKSGKPRIAVPSHRIRFGEAHEMGNPDSQLKDQFMIDVQIVIRLKVCAFIREYVPGEFEGMGLDVDFSIVKWVFVIAYPSDDHMADHLSPLKGQGGIVVFDKIGSKPIHARVLLTNTQAYLIRDTMPSGKAGFYNPETGEVE
jgi:hypothetical protein